MGSATDHPTASEELELLLGRLALEELEVLIPRPRVVDRLLDLRNAAVGAPLLVAAIDEVLRRVPGRDMVSSDWWRREVLVLTAAVEGSPADPDQIP